MTGIRRIVAAALLGVAALALGISHRALAAEALPSWNAGPAKARIVRFVAAVTNPTSPEFVPPAERIAVYDTDGTLWSEQPLSKAGKPVAINRHIGRRPILAVGYSDGDFEMLEYTTSAPGPRLGLIVHHDDAKREYAYDRESHIGRLDRGLDEAAKRGWVVVSMKSDWGRIYGP